MNGDNFNGNVDNGQQFGQQQYNQPQYGGAGNSDDKIMAIISMVLGILSIVLVCFTAGAWEIIGLLCAVAAIVLAAVSKKKFGKNGMATAGLVCGIVAIALYVLMILLVIIGLTAGLAWLGSLG